MAPGDLQEVLEALKPLGRSQPDLLIGLGAADDAAVWRITSEVAIVETVDFFPPVVDDPWTWGAISAANSMSDVFAMGGEVLFALAVAGFPREMSKAIIAEVFQGAVASRLRLHRAAAEVACETGARGATDITGFGLLGHAGEMVKASGAGLVIGASRLPLLQGARDLAEAGHWSGAMKRNRRHVDAVFGAGLRIDPSIPGYLVSLLTESETSGGLLFSVGPDRARGVIDLFRRRAEECWEIGEVISEPLIRVTAQVSRSLTPDLFGLILR